MQYSILLVGIMVFVFYQFTQPPIFFNQAGLNKGYVSQYETERRALEAQRAVVFQGLREAIQNMVDAAEDGNTTSVENFSEQANKLNKEQIALEDKATEFLQKVDSNIDSSRPVLDELHVGRHHLPDGTYGWYYNGNIDDISIYSKSVSSQEVYELYAESQCYNPIFDTITTEVFDTTYIAIHDTITTEVIDTTFVTINDTITTEVFDTTYITVTNSVSVTDTLIIDAVLTDINPPDNINTLKIYPNPAKEHVFIHTGDYSKMNGYQLKIINELGTVVYETNIEDQLYEVNLSIWTGMGLYIVQVIDSGGNVIAVKKIILQ